MDIVSAVTFVYEPQMKRLQVLPTSIFIDDTAVVWQAKISMKLSL